MATKIEFHAASDPTAELAACALGASGNRRQSLSARARRNAGVAQRRGEIERAFLRRHEWSAALGYRLFEFSLGVSLEPDRAGAWRRSLLHWLAGTIEEHELDWLLSTGHSCGVPEESRALTAFMRALRRRGMQRTRWTLTDFCGCAQSHASAERLGLLA